MYHPPFPASLTPLRAAVFTRAVAALEAGRFAEAEMSVASWSRQQPADIMAALLMGLAIAGQGDPARAAPLLQSVAEARPDCAHPCRDLAKLCPAAPALVAAQFRACRALAPDDPKLGYAYAAFLLDGGNPAPAASVLRAVLASAPGFGPAHNVYGMALFDLGDIAGAIASFRRATALDPGEGAPWANLGMALKTEGLFDAAIAACDRAVACAPDDAQIRLNRAVALLRAGRMTEAWPDYEQRLALGGGPRLPPATLLPAVAGLDLTGRTVLVWHEEGFGDTLHFARYVPLLAARGARVVAWVPAELSRLFASLDGVAEIVSGPAAVPAFDWHCPFFSLPRAFATTLDTVPGTIPYLHADPALAAAWAARMPGDCALRVGLVWAGQARPWVPSFTMLDRRRSTSLATLAPLGAVAGARFVSLQKGPAAAEARVPGGLVMDDPIADAADFADTAAIIANLDVVVSVDTAVAHLAGAMGTPVLLLDRYDSCWRWLCGREDSPWYPTLRILRQPSSGDWAPVVQRAAGMLAAMAAG